MPKINNMIDRRTRQTITIAVVSGVAITLITGEVVHPSLQRSTVWIIGIIAVAFLAMLATVGFVIRNLLERIRQADLEAREDTLTGLKNRRWLHEHLEERAGEPLALLFCDIDRFKVINDSAGHVVGDELLVEVARRLEAAVGADAAISRYGGDEFVVAVSGDDDLDERAKQLAETILAAMPLPFALSSGPTRVSLSIGVASMAKAATTTDELLREADVALGRSKKHGRGGYRIYDESLKDAEFDRLLLEQQLEQALDDEALTVHYQPIVDTDGRTVSFEALVRWQRDGELVSTGQLLPVVVDLDRMGDLGRIVLDQAIGTFAEATRDVAPDAMPLTLHVNVDASQLVDPEFPTLVSRLLSRHGLPPDRLILELTEGRWTDELDRIGPVLAELSDLGVGMAVDDFGSEYSSPARLLAVDGLTEIKIDRSIIQALSDPRTTTFATGVVRGMEMMGMTVVAEGVETLEQLRLAREAGMKFFQGYLFARPGPADTVGLVRRTMRLASETAESGQSSVKVLTKSDVSSANEQLGD